MLWIMQSILIKVNSTHESSIFCINSTLYSVFASTLAGKLSAMENAHRAYVHNTELPYMTPNVLL